MNNMFNNAYTLIEIMAQNHYQWGSEHAPAEKMHPKGAMYKVCSFDHMNVKVGALTKKVDNLSITPTATEVVMTLNCVICGVPGHITAECQFLSKPIPRPDKLRAR